VAQKKIVCFIKSMCPRISIKQTELSSLWFLKKLSLNHARKIFNNARPSYLKNNSIKIDEHHQHNAISSRFNYVMPKIKSSNNILLPCNSCLILSFLSV
jgi:hypothetical protein